MGIPVSWAMSALRHEEKAQRSGLVSRAMRAIGSRLAAAHDRRQRRLQNELLMRLDDRTLADIGLSRGDLVRGMSGPELRRHLDLTIR